MCYRTLSGRKLNELSFGGQIGNTVRPADFGTVVFVSPIPLPIRSPYLSPLPFARSFASVCQSKVTTTTNKIAMRIVVSDLHTHRERERERERAPRSQIVGGAKWGGVGLAEARSTWLIHYKQIVTLGTLRQCLSVRVCGALSGELIAI